MFFKLPYYQDLKTTVFILIIKINSINLFLPLCFKGVSFHLFDRFIQIEKKDFLLCILRIT